MGEIYDMAHYRKPTTVPVTLPYVATEHVEAVVISDIANPEVRVCSTEADIETAQDLAAVFAHFRQERPTTQA